MTTRNAKTQLLSDSQLDALVARCRENLHAGRDILDGLTDQEIDAVQTRYASFADTRDRDGFVSASEVVLKSPHTPRPFVHVMATNHDELFGQWGSFWDQHGGGFSCLDSVGAGRMTSHLDINYVPTAPEPQDVRGFFVHENRHAWPMFPIVGYEEDKYRRWSCRQGMDSFELSATRDSLSAKLNVFVHRDLPLEVWQITLRNGKKAARDISWFSRVRINIDSFPFYYFVPRVVCEGVLEDGAMVFVNHDKGNKHRRCAFMMSDRAWDGYDMMGEVFDGGVGRSPLPAAVERGACFNSLGRQPFAGLVAATQFNAHLEAGQSQTWTLVLGSAPVEQPAREAFLKQVKTEVLADPARCQAAARDTWKQKVLANAIQTPAPQIDRYFNIWSKYQLRHQLRFIAAIDKVGYRDILQYIMGSADFSPAYARAALLQTARYQYPDGRAVRQYEKFVGSGHDLRMYHDSATWMADAVVRYVKETGDAAILDEQVAFLDPQTNTPSDVQRGSMYEHVCLAVRSAFTHTGYHGLCRIGYGDWNDAISGIGGEKGVSVWLSCACVYQAKIVAELAGFLGRDDDKREFMAIADTLTQRINDHAWDGQWYVYAINGQGQPIGSSRSAEGKIHLNVNTWAIFSGVAAAAGREEQVWQAIEQLASPLGHLLLRPSYTQASRTEVGRIADILPGMFENGSMYAHGESFFLYALACAGKADAWLDEFPKTLPSSVVTDISTCPPQQQSNFAVGPDHVACGTNLFSNFTGSVGWYRKAIEKVIGVLPEFDGLRIAPRPPQSWNEFKVKRMFRGCELHIKFRRGSKNRVLMDGREADEVIPAKELPAGKRRVIEVEYT